MKKAIITMFLVTALFSLFNTPALAQSCTTTDGWPGTCVLQTECNEANANIAWQDTACEGDTATIAVGCCGVKPGAPENSRPGLGQSCKTTKGWPGTCTKNINCNQGQPGITYDQTTCKAGGCCGKQNPIIGASCTTSKGWTGTCTTHDLLYCNYANSSYAWDDTVSPCKNLNGYGCCGTDPSSPAGKSCITSKGWPGTCTTHDLLYCNYANPSYAWDNTVSPCKNLSGFGCCGINPNVTGINTNTGADFTDLCSFAQGEGKNQCDKCVTSDPPGIWTAIGCVPSTPAGFVGKILPFAMGLGGGIAFLLMLFGALQIMTSAGNPEKLNAGKELVTSAIVGLLLIIFSVFLLKLIGADILGVPGFK